MAESNQPDKGDITRLLQRHQQGDAEALHLLLPLIYGELKQLAHRWLTSQHQSWQPTALVNELFVHLFAGEPPNWQNQQHFFRTASLKIRHLLVDETRRKHALKNGGDWHKVALHEAFNSPTPMTPFEEILFVNEALQALEQDYPRPAKVVELRFFAEFSEREIGYILGIDERTVRRDWVFAKSWLLNFGQSLKREQTASENSSAATQVKNGQ